MSVILDGTSGITTPGLTNTGSETVLNLTTSGNTILGDATTDTLVVGVTGIVKDSSGNVGIGTASPAYKLDVSDQVRITRGMTITAGTSSLYAVDGALSFYAADNGVYLNGTATGFLALRGDGTGNSGSAIQINGGSYTEPYLIKFFTNSVERLRLVNSGTVILQGANTAATGTGITFPSTQSASTDANTLDDYEEGTWTPVFVGGTVSGSMVGKYVKIGKQVTVVFELNNATLSGSPNYQISGLPFTNASDRSATSAVAVHTLIGTGANDGVVGIILGNSTSIDFVYGVPNSAWGTITFRTGVASYLVFSGTYFTA